MGGDHMWRRGAVPTVLLAAFAGYCLVPLTGTPLQLWYDVIALAALAVGFAGLRRHRPATRGWWSLLAGYAGWALGDVVWLIESWLGSTWAPAPSDAVYLASYVLLGAGALAIVRQRDGGDQGAFLDSAIVSVGVAVPAVIFVITPLAADRSLDLAVRLTSSAYPVGDVFLLACLLRIVDSPGARSAAYKLLTASVAMTTVADVVWDVLVAVTGSSDFESRPLNAAWLSAYVLVGLAAAHPSVRRVAQAPPTDHRPSVSRRRVAAMGGALLLPPVVLAVDGLDGSVNWPVIAVGSAVMSLLLLARFAALLRLVQHQAGQLAALAGTDPLTGVPNRRAWDRELLRAAARRERTGPLCIALLDLDHFKAFNDTHGHPTGDLLLREAAAAWSACLPRAGFLARYGGEEFAVLLPGHDLTAAGRVLADLQAVTPRGQTFSAGLVLADAGDPPGDPAASLAAADRALYEAKHRGRDRVVGVSGGSFLPLAASGRVLPPVPPVPVQARPG